MASRYAVGITGTKTWDGSDTSIWSATDGGAGGASVPTATDDVFLTASSGVGTLVCPTPNNTSTCQNLDCTGYTGTLTLTGQLFAHPTAGGTVKFSTGMTLNAAVASALAIQSAAGSNSTLTMNGKSIGGINFTSSSTGGVTLADALTCSAGVSLTQGTLNTNGQTCSWGSFSSQNSNVRALTLGASAITVTGTGTVWTLLSSGGSTGNTNATVSSGTSTITFTGAAPSCTGLGSGGALNNVVFSGFTGTAGLGTPATTMCANLTVAPAATKNAVFNANSSNTYVITGTYTLGGNSIQGVNRLGHTPSTVGSQRDFTVGAVVITGDVDFADTNIVYSGAASWTNASSAYIGDGGNNGGAVAANATTAVTQTSTGTTSFTWSTHTWTTRVPLPQDNVSIPNAFAASQTITVDMPRIGKDIIMTCTGNPTFTHAATLSNYGSFTWASGMTNGNTSTIQLLGRGTHTYTPSGVLNQPTLSFGASGSYTLQGNLTTASGSGITILTVAGSSFDANDYNITTNSVVATAGTLFMGNGTWSLPRNTTGNVWVFQTGVTVNAEGSTVAITGTTPGLTLTFQGASKTYNDFIYTVAGGTSTVVITGSNTFNSLNVSGGRTLTLPSSSTTSVANFNVSGTVNGYYYLPGVASNNVTAPDSAVLSITGDIDLMAYVAPDDWTPATLSGLVAKWDSAGSRRSYRLDIGTDGKLGMVVSPNGTSVVQVLSTVATGFTDGTGHWVRATMDVNNGSSQNVVKFYTSDDSPGTAVGSVTWTQLGSTVTTAGATSIQDNISILELGSLSLGTGNFLIGKLYRAAIRDGYDGAGTVQFDADFTTRNISTSNWSNASKTTFVEGSVNAATVTINGAPAQAGDGRVVINSSSSGTPATLSRGPGKVLSEYVSIKDSNAVGGALFQARNSADISGNSHWVFADSIGIGAGYDYFGSPYYGEYKLNILYQLLADTITLSDSSVSSERISKTDTITLSDSVAKMVYRAISDSLTLSDLLAQARQTFIADIISLSDSESMVRVHYGASGEEAYPLTLSDIEVPTLLLSSLNRESVILNPIPETASLKLTEVTRVPLVVVSEKETITE